MWDTVVGATIFIACCIGTLLLLRLLISHTRTEFIEVCYICGKTIDLRVGTDSNGRLYYICQECAGYMREHR